MKKIKKITMTFEVEETEVPETDIRESSIKEWDEKSPEEKKTQLREAETTVFADDLEDMFVSVDVGGELNFLWSQAEDLVRVAWSR